MLLIRSRSTDCSVFVDRQQVLALARARRRSCSSAGGGSAPTGALLRRLALDELLADQRLRADHAAARRGGSPGSRVVDVEHDGGLEVGRDVERVDLADLDAGDLDVLAGDRRSRRCRRSRAPCRTAAVAGAGGQHRGGGERRAGGRRRRRASSGPRGHLARVAVVGAEVAVVGVRRRAVRRPAGWRRPGSACVTLVCEPVEALRSAGSGSARRRPGCR